MNERSVSVLLQRNQILTGDVFPSSDSIITGLGNALDLFQCKRISFFISQRRKQHHFGTVNTYVSFLAPRLEVTYYVEGYLAVRVLTHTSFILFGGEATDAIAFEPKR